MAKRNQLRDRANSKENLAASVRRQKVLDMRLLGASLRRIALKLGVSHETVRGDLQKALVELNSSEKAKTSHLRSLELQRLDVATNAIANKVLEGDCPAIDRWLKIGERRAKLLGLDAPEDLNITGNLLTEKTNEELRRIVAAQQVARSSDSASTVGADSDDGE